MFFTSKYIGNNMIEPFLFLGIIFASNIAIIKNTILGIVRYKFFLIFIYILTILFFLGLLNTYQLVYVYADFRCIILLVFSFFLFSDTRTYEWQNGSFIKLLLWSVIIMDLAYSMIMLKLNLAGIEDARIRMITPISCVVLMYLYLTKWKNLGLAFVLLSIIAYHTVVSSMRNFYIIFALSFILFLINMTFAIKAKITYKIILILIIILIPIYTWKSILNFWMSDASRSIHSVNRVEELISGQSNEAERINSILLPFTDITYYLIPHGIGWRGFIEDIQKRYEQKNILSTMDSAFYYMCFHFGLILTMILVLFFSRRFLNAIKYQKKISKLNIIILILLFVVAFFTQATMFAYLSFAFGYGILLSQIIGSPRHNFVTEL